MDAYDLRDWGDPEIVEGGTCTRDLVVAWLQSVRLGDEDRAEDAASAELALHLVAHLERELGRSGAPGPGRGRESRTCPACRAPLVYDGSTSGMQAHGADVREWETTYWQCPGCGATVGVEWIGGQKTEG